MQAYFVSSCVSCSAALRGRPGVGQDRTALLFAILSPFAETKEYKEKIMSIATTRGDGGQTGLAGGIRISKADLRVEAYGTVDELNSALGFARSICTYKEISDWTEKIQRTLFR